MPSVPCVSVAAMATALRAALAAANATAAAHTAAATTTPTVPTIATLPLTVAAPAPRTLTLSQFLTAYALTRYDFDSSGGDCFFVALAFLLNLRQGAASVTPRQLRTMCVAHIRARLLTDPVYASNLQRTFNEHGGGQQRYLTGMERSFEEFSGKPGVQPLHGDEVAMTSLCDIFSVSLKILSADRQELVYSIDKGPASAAPLYMLWFTEREVRLASGQRHTEAGHYVPLLHTPRPNALPLSALPQRCSAVGTEVHFAWKTTNGLIPVLPEAAALCTQDWVQNTLPPLPPEHRETFTFRGVDAGVQLDKMLEGMYSMTIIARVLQLFDQKLHRLREHVPANTPRTLVWDALVGDQLFRRQRNGFLPPRTPDDQRTDEERYVQPHDVGVYSYQHAMKQLQRSCTLYPRRRPLSEVTPEWILTHDNILLPFMDCGHFVLLHVCVQQRRVRILDSCTSCGMPSRATVMAHVLHLMQDMSNRHAPNDNRQWREQAAPANIPQQNDIYSCGPFVCMFAAQIYAGSDACTEIGQHNIENIKKNLLWLLVDNPPRNDAR